MGLHPQRWRVVGTSEAARVRFGQIFWGHGNARLVGCAVRRRQHRPGGCASRRKQWCPRRHRGGLHPRRRRVEPATADSRKHQVVKDQIRKIPPSTAHSCLYVGLKDTAANLGLAGTNIWVYPGPNHDANLETFFSDPSAHLPTVYISFPSAKDPDFERRHPNRATVEVITFTPHHWFEKWQDTHWRRRGPDYDVLKEELASRLLAELIRQVPALDGKIDYSELSTPLSTRHFMNHQRGEMYGLSSTPERFRLRCLTPKTPIRQLYLTGQDVSCLGVTGALFGGFLTASAILGRNVIGELGKRRPKQKPGAGPSKASMEGKVTAESEPVDLTWRRLIAHYA